MQMGGGRRRVGLQLWDGPRRTKEGAEPGRRGGLALKQIESQGVQVGGDIHRNACGFP